VLDNTGARFFCTHSDKHTTTKTRCCWEITQTVLTKTCICQLLAQINERVTELILSCKGPAPKYRSHFEFLYGFLYLPAASLSLVAADGLTSHTQIFISFINKFSEFSFRTKQCAKEKKRELYI
jgi:hypothetical protein